MPSGPHNSRSTTNGCVCKIEKSQREEQEDEKEERKQKEGRKGRSRRRRKNGRDGLRNRVVGRATHTHNPLTRDRDSSPVPRTSCSLCSHPGLACLGFQRPAPPSSANALETREGNCVGEMGV
ncbi:hypothetical protein PoB_001541900 [Plakobranchus ocellatus]|uniref:Uncharacterized protein n=1 Tax=Plakobranchus ocellatus TaxID=259542 RepID=A0AAV3Z4H6_9GAST|nr:hypothetical protein PoB_001541900 [Plakobranchus ocellatus]